MTNNQQKPRISQENWEKKCVPHFLMAPAQPARETMLNTDDLNEYYGPQSMHNDS